MKKNILLVFSLMSLLLITLDCYSYNNIGTINSDSTIEELFALNYAEEQLQINTPVHADVSSVCRKANYTVKS